MPDYDEYNPIRYVNNSTIKTPSSLSWTKTDASGDASGRTEAFEMVKDKKAEKRRLDIVWNNISYDDAYDILGAFGDEYFNVTYFEPNAKGFIQKRFYAGDMSCDWKNARLERYATLSFAIIEV